MEEALKLEKQVNGCLLELHAISSDRSDPQVSHNHSVWTPFIT